MFINKKNQGFTLLEILIALFIFTIVATLLANILHQMITVESRTEERASHLRELQTALLIFSRDVEQAINRPIRNAGGIEEPAFIGTSRDVTFTRTGVANPAGDALQSSLQRVEYFKESGNFFRKTWAALDQAPNTPSHTRRLLTDVNTLSFEYVGKEDVYTHWPVDEEMNDSLPRAVRIKLTVKQWGTISQLYVIPVRINQAPTTASPKP